MDLDEVIRQATSEIEQEAFRDAVNQAKERIKQRRDRPLWRVVFPFNIKIERID